MANIKDIRVSARIPFHYYQDDELARKFAFMQSPTSGFSVSFAADGYDPNQFGGQTAMYRVSIRGHEAVRYERLESLVAAIWRIGGTINDYEIVDEEL